MPVYTICAVEACGRKPANWSRYCATHVSGWSNNGHPTVRAITRWELRKVKWVEHAILTHRGTRAVQAALAAADLILHYEPTAGYVWQHRLRERMTTIRERGVTPLQILVGVVEVYAVLAQNAHRMPSLQAEHYALARAVFRTTSQGTWRPNGKVLRGLGAIVADAFAVFSYSLFKQLHLEGEQRANQLKVMSDFHSHVELP